MSGQIVDADCIGFKSSVMMNSDSELTDTIKLDLCDDSNDELELQQDGLIEDNLKKEYDETEVMGVYASDITTESKSSPLSKSRYGRIHKPKIDEDFFSTDKKVGAILGLSIFCTPQKTSGTSSKTSTPRKNLQSPSGLASDIATTDLDTSAENLSRTYRELCNIIFSPQTENFKGFSRDVSGAILSSFNDMPECKWMPGDLAWARVGSHPYWPCIVTVDPTVQTFKKIGLRGLRCRLLIHVQFYGDKGRRSWLSSSAMRAYEGLDAFNKLCDEMIHKFKCKYRKLRDPYIVRPSSKPKWDTAVCESEAVHSLTREMRLLDFISRYPKVQGDEVIVLSPEQERNVQVKRKAVVSPGFPVWKKARTAGESEGSRSVLVKKKLSLSDDAASPEKKNRVQSSREDVKPPSSPEVRTALSESPTGRKKVQATLEQFFSVSRPAAADRKTDDPPRNEAPPTKEIQSEDETVPGAESLVQDELLQTSIASPGVEDAPKREKDVLVVEEMSKRETDEQLVKEVPKHEPDDVAPKGDVLDGLTPKTRKSRRLNLSLSDEIRVKAEVLAVDDTSAVPVEPGSPVETPRKSGDDSSDEWQPSRLRERAGPGEKPPAPTSQDRGKPASQGEEAFYQFSLVHTQIVLDDNPGWGRDKVDSYVRMLWNNLDDGDKTKYGKRTDAENKKSEGVKVEKPPKRLYARKKKEVEVSDDESSSSTSSEDQDFIKEDAPSVLTFTERKPASLFRGMKKEKVCQVCEVAGGTVRCKGPCLGVYHAACLPGAGVVAGPCPAEAAVSSDSGVEESDSDSGPSRGDAAEEAAPPGAGASSVAGAKSLGRSSRRASQEAPLLAAEGEWVKRPVKKKSKKGDRDEDSEEDKSSLNYLCPKCVQGITPPCFACSREVSESGEEKKQRCIIAQCGKFYHPGCLNLWPQAFNNCISRGGRPDDTNLTCPQHTCHTCASDDPRNFNTRFTNERLVRCVRCPTAYHFGNHCVPAGSIVLNMTQIICSRHCDPQRKGSHHVNAAWCFICAMGGSLICCDLCPTSFHAECLNISPPEGGYVCEDCGTGRFPLYGEIVWAKLGNYRWWPAQIVFPDQVPENIDNLQHSEGEFVVRFFGSHDYNWVNRSRVFLYQEGDSAYKKSGKTSVDTVFQRAVLEAQDAHRELNLAKATREAEPRQALKPPQYVKIKCNKPVGSVRVMECDPSSLVPCYCDPDKESPCGPDSDCLNRILMVECSPSVCRAGDKCRNQRFEKREYPPLIPYKTDGRGWGLKTLADIKKGDFVIEYVGEMIDETEYKRRLERKHLEKDENYYFLTIDKDRMLDAGPKGNVSRFMNHSCRPNCETQKWTVNGDTRVGLFALEDIPANTEVTFNYNLQCASTDKKQCMCGAPNCSGFIGSKASKVVGDERKPRALHKGRKKVRSSPAKLSGECFRCGESGEVIACDNKTCPKKYHRKCVALSKPPEGKWTCPWHQCSVCKKHRTSKRCTLCPNAYCAQHEEGNIWATAKEAYCKEHEQAASADVGSPHCASRTSAEGSEGSEQASRAARSKHRTPVEQKAAAGVGRTSETPSQRSKEVVIITELRSDGISPGAIRKSVRKSLSLHQGPFQAELLKKGMKPADAHRAVADTEEEGSGEAVASRAGAVADRKDSGDSERASSSSRDEFPDDMTYTGALSSDACLAFPSDDEASGQCAVARDEFCEFQESRRKDLIEMRRAQYKRIGQNAPGLCHATSPEIDTKSLDVTSPVLS